MHRILNWKAIAGIVGVLLVALGIALIAPMVVGVLYGEPEWWSFGMTAAVSMVVGWGMWRTFRPEGDVNIREGFAIVALAWLVLSLVGAFPYVLTGVLGEYTDAFFETMSGFTTTGATILGGADTPAIEEIPNAFLFWRSLTQWLGGMGVIVLMLAILPLLGIGGVQLFKAEVPGPDPGKLTPRVTETAKRLWVIYVGITVLEILLLIPAVGLFDAVNHGFTTMATGGFSTENGSIGQYQSVYVEWVITAFMLLAGFNFVLYYMLLKGGWRRVLKGEELRMYIGLIVGLTVVMTMILWVPSANVLPGDVSLDGEIVQTDGELREMDHGIVAREEVIQEERRVGGETIGGGAEMIEQEAAQIRQVIRYESFPDALRYAAFQVASILTTTGYGTADYEFWPPLAVVVIFLLFFTGGMAGSTGGGIKIVRLLLLHKNAWREIRQLMHPNAVLPLHLDGEAVPKGVMRNVLTFTTLYFALVALGTFVMAFLGLDLMSAFSATFSSIANVGPAFGTMGPTENYTHVPPFGKWFLAFLMMAGRLEIFTALILVSKAFWKR